MEKLLRANIGDTLDIDFSYTHPNYRQMYANWLKNRDFARGVEYVKKRRYSDLHRFDETSGLSYAGDRTDEVYGTAYLPIPNGMLQDLKAYRDYRERAQLYNASGMTVESFMGMLYRKPPVFGYEPIDEDIQNEIRSKVLKRVTPDNRSFTDLCRTISEEVIITNKVGILVDFPSTIRDRELSRLEYEELNLTPKVSVYNAETIINWTNTTVDDEVIPLLFVLDESGIEFDYEKFTFVEVEQYRILLLEDIGNDFIYHQILVKNTSKSNTTKKKFEVIDKVTPMKEGRVLNRIPFYVIDKDGLNYDVTGESIINDLVDVNLGHYRNSADLEHNLYLLGLKTLVLPGYSTDTYGPPSVGGVLTGPMGFKPFMIEPSSDSGIEKEMQNKEQRMAVLGSQAISQRGKYVQSAATAKINSASEASILASLANFQSDVLTTVLNLILEWSGYSDVKGTVHINTDFYDDIITPDSVIRWTQLRQAGGISTQTWYYNLEKRDVFPPDWSLEKELGLIEEADLSIAPDNALFKQQALAGQANRKYESKPDPDEESEGQEDQELGL
jgi:hypothetical protein